MPKRQEEVDWYVEMSERIERRERRRKWVVLGLCVAVPLLLMGGAVVLIQLHRHGYLGALTEWLGLRRTFVGPSHPSVPQTKEILVERFEEMQIKFSQLDPNGLVTSTIHAFRELLPENAKAFTVNADEDETHGTIALYRLRNLATGEVLDFSDIPVRKVSTAGWLIEPEVGWKMIQEQLQARLKTQLAIIGR